MDRARHALRRLLIVSLPVLGCAGSGPMGLADRTTGSRASLHLRAPELSLPLAESFPAASQPQDPIKAAVFERINQDREAWKLPPVAWDETASRVADSFCAQQIQEATRGHFLMDGLPPYARTGFAGIFAMQAENSLSWVTTESRFLESATHLALMGHEQMMAEKPPSDGHRQTILGPEATHVGVGYALERGRFQMAQEFLVRSLERLSLALSQGPSLAVRVKGKPLPKQRLQFVTIGWEPPPVRLAREEATGRTSYSYPPPNLAYIPEGHIIQIGGITGQDRIQLRPGGEFSFTFTPNRPGLYTLVFYTTMRDPVQARPGGSATVWVE